MSLPLSPHPLSEQKVFRGLIIDYVDEKNQKNEKLLPEKKGVSPGKPIRVRLQLVCVWSIFSMTRLLYV